MTLLLLFYEFFKVGLFTFGGGYAMIPLIKEAVLKHAWLAESEFYDFIGVCESTPGPIAINMATYIGASQAGFLGSVAATLAVVLPSFIIIILVATVMEKVIKHRVFRRIMQGVKPVISGLIFSTGLMLLIKAAGYNGATFTPDLISIIILLALAIFYLLYKLILGKKMNAILLIVIAAVLGIVLNVGASYYGMI